MALKKSAILVSLDEEALLELRKILFRRGLGPHEFFAFMVDRLILEEERMEELVQELSEAKSQDLMRGGIDRKNVTANSLYEAIEAELNEEENDISKED